MVEHKNFVLGTWDDDVIDLLGGWLDGGLVLPVIPHYHLLHHLTTSFGFIGIIIFGKNSNIMKCFILHFST